MNFTPEQIEAWRQRYVARLVERGLEEEHAQADYDGGDHDYAEDPVQAADESLSYYEDDGDEAES